MNDRIKNLRKTLNLTQQQFADKLSLKRQTVASYEIGKISPSDSTIAFMCREFNVNEEWLRTGEGEMFTSSINLSEIPHFNDLPLDEQKEFMNFINTYLELDDISRDALKTIAHKLVEKKG